MSIPIRNCTCTFQHKNLCSCYNNLCNKCLGMNSDKIRNKIQSSILYKCFCIRFHRFLDSQYNTNRSNRYHKSLYIPYNNLPCIRIYNFPYRMIYKYLCNRLYRKCHNHFYMSICKNLCTLNNYCVMNWKEEYKNPLRNLNKNPYKNLNKCVDNSLYMFPSKKIHTHRYKLHHIFLYN